MTRDQIAQILRDKGHYAQVTGAETIRCGQNADGTGINFRLVWEESHWDIALNSGRHYRCPVGTDAYLIAMDLLSGAVPAAEVATTLPKSFCDKYSLHHP